VIPKIERHSYRKEGKLRIGQNEVYRLADICFLQKIMICIEGSAHILLHKKSINIDGHRIMKCTKLEAGDRPQRTFEPVEVINGEAKRSLSWYSRWSPVPESTRSAEWHAITRIRSIPDLKTVNHIIPRQVLVEISDCHTTLAKDASKLQLNHSSPALYQPFVRINQLKLKHSMQHFLDAESIKLILRSRNLNNSGLMIFGLIYRTTLISVPNDFHVLASDGNTHGLGSLKERLRSRSGHKYESSGAICEAAWDRILLRE
jgi:hypothetical protein